MQKNISIVPIVICFFKAVYKKRPTLEVQGVFCIDNNFIFTIVEEFPTYPKQS